MLLIILSIGLHPSVTYFEERTNKELLHESIISDDLISGFSYLHVKRSLVSMPWQVLKTILNCMVYYLKVIFTWFAKVMICIMKLFCSMTPELLFFSFLFFISVYSSKAWFLTHFLENLCLWKLITHHTTSIKGFIFSKTIGS